MLGCGVVVHALVLVYEADFLCSGASPAAALWWNAYPRISVLQNKSVGAGINYRLHMNPLIQATSCRFDLVVETEARDGALGASIEEFPSELAHWSSLLSVDLRNNNITTIPVEILQIQRLRSALLAGNPVQEHLDISNTGILKDGKLPYRLLHLKYPEWDLNLRSLSLSNSSLRRLPPNLPQLMPCLESLYFLSSDPIIESIPPNLYQIFYDFKHNRSAREIQKRCTSAESSLNREVSFRLIVEDDHVNAVANWSLLSNPLAKRDRTKLSKGHVWEFFSVFPRIELLDLRCSGLEVLIRAA